MSKIQNVAVAGATGLLGKPIVQALLDANFTVTALTRDNSKANLPSAVKIVHIDYNNLDNIIAALRGQDALVSTLATAAIGLQEKLFEAAIQAGVQRLIPSEFGCDLSNPKTRQLPVYAKKIEAQDFIQRKTQGTRSTYTFIYNNVFLDGAIDLGFVINLKEKKMEVFNGGDSVYTTTPLSFIAKGVVGVLQHPEETANKHVRLHGISITQNKFLAIAKHIVGEDGWELVAFDTKEMERKGYENFEKDPGNFAAWGYNMLKPAIFDHSYGCDFSQHNDNELLGLQALSEKDVEDIIRSRA